MLGPQCLSSAPRPRAWPVGVYRILKIAVPSYGVALEASQSAIGLRDQLMMKRLFWCCIFVLAFATTWPAVADVFVHGYYRHSGTYVQPHYRSSPNGTVTDNYSYHGNINPHTGRVGTNYYRHDLTSPYYTGPDSHGHVGHASANVSALPYAEYRGPSGTSLCPPPYRMTAQDGCQR